MLRFGMAAVAVTLIPALLAAQTDTSRMRGSDTTRGRSGRQQQSSAGTIGRTNGGMRLNHDQVTQLQTALQQNGCDPGAIDGVMGAHTRRAMRCARQKNNITSNNPGALYQSLNLNFSASDTGAVGRSSTGADSSRRRGGMRADSTRRQSTRSDSTRRRPRTARPDSTRRP